MGQLQGVSRPSQRGSGGFLLTPRQLFQVGEANAESPVHPCHHSQLGSGSESRTAVPPLAPREGCGPCLSLVSGSEAEGWGREGEWELLQVRLRSPQVGLRP